MKTTVINASHRIIGGALKELGKYISERQPVISGNISGSKKRKLVGNFPNKGVEWHPFEISESGNAYDFLTEEEGVAIPYGVYDFRVNICG